MTRLNIDIDGIAKRVHRETDRRKAFEATTPRLIFREDWRDGKRTFREIRGGEIGIMTWDKTPKFSLYNTIYGTVAKGASLLRHPQASDAQALATIDVRIADLQRERRALLDAAWWRGDVVTKAEVEGFAEARKRWALDDA